LRKDNGSFFSAGRIAAILAIVLLVPAVIALGISVWDDRKFYLVSLIIIVITAIPFILSFERRKPQARELVLLAAMIALAVAGRAAFYMLPQFKPMSAIVIITGVAFGCESGFVAGAMTAFVSNFIFGQGPWTPWQMAALGLVGFLAGLIFHRKDGRMPKLLPLLIYGALSTLIVYGLIVDTSTVFTTYSRFTWELALAAYSSGFVFNLIHAASTVVFLLLLAKPLLKKLNRVRVKYGLLE
jgi:energy-coupling factor transport system substrate-specific component